MKKSFYVVVIVCMLVISGCSRSEKNVTTKSYYNQDTKNFISGMGCYDINCTDPTHHHDCSKDCNDYNHHHYCDLDCTNPSHNHIENSHHDENNYKEIYYEDIDDNYNEQATTSSFVSGMGCSNPNCTDPTHHHDCSLDCNDYSHHHNCNLDCTNPNHHHSNSNVSNNTGHHSNNHHHGSHH